MGVYLLLLLLEYNDIVLHYTQPELIDLGLGIAEGGICKEILSIGLKLILYEGGRTWAQKQKNDSKGNILDHLPDGSEIKQNKDNILIGEVGGIIKVKSVDEQMKLVITGNNAKGYINITW